MAYKTPQQTAEAAVESGVTKAPLPAGKALVGGFLAGAYIAFGSLLAIAVTSGLQTTRGSAAHPASGPSSASA